MAAVLGFDAGPHVRLQIFHPDRRVWNEALDEVKVSEDLDVRGRQRVETHAFEFRNGGFVRDDAVECDFCVVEILPWSSRSLAGG
jgi:hypothetical protein